MRHLSRAIVAAACCGAIAVPIRATQDGDDGHHGPRRYHVVELSSIGGTNSRGQSINNLNWVAGWSNEDGNATRHATLWIHGFKVDLGTLGGPNSSVQWPVKNTRGLLAGIAETNTPQPRGESWSCSAFFPSVTGKICRGVVWEWGAIRELPTLGGSGSNSFATGANNRREVVGWSENGVEDSTTCTLPQVFQFRPVVWGPGRDQIRELPLFPGDNSGAATAINDRGQVVGISGECDQAVGRLTAKHALLWEHGRIRDIGNLGVKTWNTPMAITQRGDTIVGFAGQPDDPEGERVHAFVWRRGQGRGQGMREILPFEGHVYSSANGVNERGQVVGTSCSEGFVECRAFLWQHGVMTALDDLREPGYKNLLTSGQDINDDAVITGRALDETTRERPAFIAFPIPRDRVD
jgi:probable HAF family extracellular repeat protein